MFSFYFTAMEPSDEEMSIGVITGWVLGLLFLAVVVSIFMVIIAYACRQSEERARKNAKSTPGDAPTANKLDGRSNSVDVPLEIPESTFDDIPGETLEAPDIIHDTPGDTS